MLLGFSKVQSQRKLLQFHGIHIAMQEIYKPDKDIAIELIKSVLRHGWCFSKKLAVLAIVDEDLDDSLVGKLTSLSSKTYNLYLFDPVFFRKGLVLMEVLSMMSVKEESNLFKSILTQLTMRSFARTS